mmetsp:Transcript_17713/g.30990  ORF Transcript_17713/g.30990 Transcript_17713/m.30990 type:complete len:345 (-) Transcript_17713:42-1076(-)
MVAPSFNESFVPGNVSTSTIAPVDLLAAASITIQNFTNATHWPPTVEEVEHFLGDPDVLYTFALLLGIAAILLGKRLPALLAVVSSVTLALFVGLLVQDRQRFKNPLWGTIELPQGTWFPWFAGLFAGAAAAGLSYVTWKAALAMLTGGLVMLIAIAVCRMANVSPDKIFRVGSNLLSSYRIIGAVVLVVMVVLFWLIVQKAHNQMANFASANLGTLLLLSAVSHFSARVGAEAPFSLLDDFARIAAEVRGGNCHLWKREDQDDTGFHGCDCSEKCRSEIGAWIASSITVIVCRWLLDWYRRRKEEQKKRKPTEEETAPLSAEGASPAQAAPQVIGATQADTQV